MTRVQDLIDNMINPVVAGRGGFVRLVDVMDKKVYLQLGSTDARFLPTSCSH